jgi:hypothetical protein
LVARASLARCPQGRRQRWHRWRAEQHLIAYFADLAAHWRGWDGQLSWRDADAQLGLDATHDGIGHITLRVLVSPQPRGLGPWETHADLTLEPGELDWLLDRIRRFLSDGHVAQASASDAPDG